MVHVPGSCGLRGLRALAILAFGRFLFPRVWGGGFGLRFFGKGGGFRVFFLRV